MMHMTDILSKKQSMVTPKKTKAIKTKMSIQIHFTLQRPRQAELII